MTALFEIDWYAMGVVAAFLAAIYYILFIRRDRFEDYRDRPACYGSEPGAQARAENCCDDCPHAIPCLMPAPPLDALLPPHLRSDRPTPRVSMFGICADCGGTLSPHFGGLENHRSDCPRLPL